VKNWIESKGHRNVEVQIGEPTIEDVFLDLMQTSEA
jgi:hypothetical protein